MFAKDFRKIARDRLKNYWGLATVTGLISALLGANNGNAFASHIDYVEPSNTGMGIGDAYTGVTFYNIPFTADHTVGLTIMFMISLAIFLIAGAITVGYARFNLRLVEREQVSLSMLFSEFSRFWRAFAMHILRFVYIFLWTLLLIIPGVIARYAYALTPYIMEQRSELTASEAIAASKEMMKGNKGSLFYLHMTFIGWALLCMLPIYLWIIFSRLYWQINFSVLPIFIAGIMTLIAFLMLYAYISAAEAAFYQHVSGKSKQVVSNDGAPSEPKSRPPMVEEPVPVERTKDRNSSLDMDNL